MKMTSLLLRHLYWEQFPSQLSKC